MSASMRTWPVDSRQPAGGHFNPDHGIVGAAQAEEIVGDGAVARETIDEENTRALVGEPVGLERRSDASGVSAG